MNNNIDIEFVKYEFAKYSFQECLKFLDLHKKLHTYVQDNLSFGIMLSTAFVVTYARPFSNSNRQYYEKRMGAISTKWLKKLRQSLTDKHNYLIGTGRNALAAHIDLGKLMLNVFVKDGLHNDYIFDLHLPTINDNSLSEYEELTKAALQFCQAHQDSLKPNLSSNHLIPQFHHPDASYFVKRSSKKSAE